MDTHNIGSNPKDGKIYHTALIRIRTFVDGRGALRDANDLLGPERALKKPLRYMPQLALFDESVIIDFQHGLMPIHGAN